MRTTSSIEAALREKYSGKIEETRGYSYIPWNDAVDVANEIFGATGWSSSVISVRESSDGSGYESIVRITVSALTEDAALVECHHDGVGYSEIQSTKDGRLLRDTAIKAAESDGISRALKKFGDAFGLFLYDKESSGTFSRPQTSNGSQAGRQSTGGRASRPTEKMLNTLKRNKVPEHVLDSLDFDTASAMIGEFIKGGKLNDVLAAHGLTGGRRSPLDELEDADVF